MNWFTKLFDKKKEKKEKTERYWGASDQAEYRAAYNIEKKNNPNLTPSQFSEKYPGLSYLKLIYKVNI